MLDDDEPNIAFLLWFHKHLPLHYLALPHLRYRPVGYKHHREPCRSHRTHYSKRLKKWYKARKQRVRYNSILDGLSFHEARSKNQSLYNTKSQDGFFLWCDKNTYLQPVQKAKQKRETTPGQNRRQGCVWSRKLTSQTEGPHCSQTSCVQPASRGAHVPHDSLQQYSPTPQTFGPQVGTIVHLLSRHMFWSQGSTKHSRGAQSLSSSHASGSKQ